MAKMRKGKESPMTALCNSVTRDKSCTFSSILTTEGCFLFVRFERKLVIERLHSCYKTGTYSTNEVSKLDRNSRGKQS